MPHQLDCSHLEALGLWTTARCCQWCHNRQGCLDDELELEAGPCVVRVCCEVVLHRELGAEALEQVFRRSWPPTETAPRAP